MSKTVKKKSRRMWRTVRKTLGTLFLVSALVIAAIPVDGLQASNVETNPFTEDTKSKIPDVEGKEIFCSENGAFQFAYVQDGSTDKGAVILGYAGGEIQNNALTIDNTVDAYAKYTGAAGTGEGYVAITEAIDNKDNATKEFLFYPSAYETVIDTPEQKDPITGEVIQPAVTHQEPTAFTPCYATNYDVWKEFDERNELYWCNDPNASWTETKKYTKVSNGHSRLRNIQVWYIGNQFLTEDTKNNTWQVLPNSYIGDKDPKGIFAGYGNIVSLTVGPSLRGIGNSAFYNCTGLNKITLGNGLKVLGNYAFAACNNLTEVNIPAFCNLQMIGAHAFNDCVNLRRFVVPINVTGIGDGAFEGCTALTQVVMNGTELTDEELDAINHPGKDENGQDIVHDYTKETISFGLKKLGQHVFNNCASLRSVTFPANFTNDGTNKVDLAMFAGCTSLQSITTYNTALGFGDDYDTFKNVVPSTFYFEGYDVSAVHTTAQNNYFAFKYLDQDLYEIRQENGDVYRVNSENKLQKSDIGSEDVVLPDNIGPYHIEVIDSNAFKNNCKIKKITIPSTVSGIADEAFMGCHQLKHVIFAEPVNQNLTIGKDAFKTQQLSSGHSQSGCPAPNLDPTPELNFVGPISSDSVPFLYAMNADNNIDVGGQTRNTYIAYYSTWPQSLKVQYTLNNPENKSEGGKRVLVDFPSFADFGDSAYLNKLGHVSAEDRKVAVEAVNAFLRGGTTDGMLGDQAKIIDAARKIEICDGIEAVAPGLFYEKEQKNLGYCAGKTNLIETEVTAFTSLQKIDSGTDPAAATFAGCQYLKSFTLNDGVGVTTPTVIGDYAFDSCAGLAYVSISPTVSGLGICPFHGCENLSDVNFQSSPYFVCEKSIIFGKDESGNKSKVIECLEGRPGNLREVMSSEFGPGIKEIAQEAFRGSGVRSVDFSGTNITTIPEGAFANTKNLQTVTLPETLTLVGNYAFAGSTVDCFYVKGKNTGCAPFAFYGESTDEESTKRYGVVGLKKSPKEVGWYYAKDGVTSEATGSAQGFLTEEYEFPTAYYVIYTYRGEDGEFTDFTLEQRVSSVDEAKLSYPNIPQKVTVKGMTYSFTDWEYVLENGDTWHFTAQYDFALHVVTFMDSKDGLKEVYRMEIADGGNALRRAKDVEELAAIMNDPSFVAWDCEGNLEEVTGNYTAVAKYRNEGEYVVRFFVRKGSITSAYEMFYTTTVKQGSSAPSISVPAVTDYVFTEWDKPLNSIQEDTDFYARYAPASGGNQGGNTGSGNNPGGPDGPAEGQHTLRVQGGSGSGYYAKDEQIVITANPPADGMEFSGWDVSPADTVIVDKTRATTIITMPDKDVAVIANYKAKNGVTGSGNTGSGNGVRHTLQVRGGSGSGYYAAGEQIIITADEPARGQVFSGWTVSPANTVVTDKTLSAIIITMPNNDVALIANYKARSTSGTTVTGSSSNTNSNRPGTSIGTVGGGTTVVIDKNGLSNTGVVSATVNGSSDNFTIKITESTSATEAVLRALQAEYGNLDNLKYFPMDISLYDSTGNTKITDTTGLSVSITLPLPDSLITYAGNNKVAGVVNDRLDKLTPRFTTINGVPCITFTAEHFSPYVIYVDLTNLSDGTISDNTPTTGDGIHPKWFLSIGLACLSFVMFMIKDNKGGSRNKGASRKQKVAVKVRN